jgi:hypothetical protein
MIFSELNEIEYVSDPRVAIPCLFVCLLCFLPFFYSSIKKGRELIHNTGLAFAKTESAEYGTVFSVGIAELNVTSGMAITEVC